MVFSPVSWSTVLNNSSGERYCEDGSYMQPQSIQAWHEDLQPIFSSRVPNDSNVGRFPCPTCGKVYLRSRSLWRHRNYECGKDPQFHCPYCNHQTKQKSSLKIHILRIHAPKQANDVGWKFTSEDKELDSAKHCDNF